MPRSFKSLAAKLGLSFSSVGLTLLLLEAVFRACGIRAEYYSPRVWQVFGNPTEPRGPVVSAMPFSTVRLTYASDPRNYFEPGNIIRLVHNSVGWRDAEHSFDKPLNTYRILGLGDSYLWGEGVRREDICLNRLRDLLTERVRGTTVETINSGFSSLNTIHERYVLTHMGLRYNPDLVILHFVPNDVVIRWHTGPKVEFGKEYRAIYESPDWLTNYSNLWGWARQRYLREWRANSYIRECQASFSADNSDWRQCRRALNDIQEICQGNDISLLVVIFPFFHKLDGAYPFQGVHDIVRSHCESRRIPVLDLRDAYRSYHGPELWVHPTDQHPNEIAHAIAAHAIATFLMHHPEVFHPQ